MVAIGSKNVLILFILSTFFCTQILSNCVDNLSATNHRSIRRVACPLVTDDDSSRHSKRQEPRIMVSQFHCDNATQKTCNNVRRTFEEAGKIIAETFVLKQSILVEVEYTNICQKEPSLCEDKDNAVIGSGRSARDMLILDDDGIARYYPQTLVKQFDLQPHPEYAPIDIICSFNSLSDWYFTDQPTPIRPNQRDMLYLAIHELMHGLGFLSQWNFWFDIGDPKRTLITTQPEVASTDKNETLFGGFKEAAFDRFLSFNRKSHKRLTGVTKELNKFAKSGTVFKNDSELINSFVESKQVKLADSMSKETTTPKRVACLPRPCADVTMILETSLDPFQPGSSVSHVDGKTYTNTPDFLMISKPISGKTLKEILKQVGGEHPIGPKLKALMGCLGWATKENPNPYRPKLAP